MFEFLKNKFKKPLNVLFKESIKGVRKGTPTTTSPLPFENMDISGKIEILGKMIANLCSQEQKNVGGDAMSFKIENVTDSRTGNSLGSVIITWEL